MANALFLKARESFLDAEIKWKGDDIRAALCGGSKPDLNSAEFLSDVQHRVAVSSPLTNKSITDGVARASPAIFRGVQGREIGFLVVFKYNTDPKASRLIAYIDTLSGRGAFPVKPNGGDMEVAWDRGPNGIFKL